MNMTIGNQRYTIFKLREDLKSVKSENQLMREHNGSLRKSFEECYEKREELQNNYTQVLLSLKECTISKSNLETQYKECTISKSNLETQYEECTISKSNLETQYEECSKNVSLLNSNYEECSKQKEEMEKVLKKQKDEKGLITLKYPQIEFEDLPSTFGDELNDAVDYEINSCIENNGKFNETIVISNYDKLETIKFGNNCNKRTSIIILKNLPNLRSVYFGKHSFSLYEDSSPALKQKSSLVIMNCDKLTSIKLDEGAFKYYERLILQSGLQYLFPHS